ncbi:zinc finger BED domain-containing protein 4-like [Acipenser oxyrinchus oxyrinchus]|uniref:Zinc finger BED domain-containing protein 4-like n=1 Tax=Acipenser oxyrinchus oxyrinchus TaxID=40147 RepID=A0AAD8GA90_ACIOX|nr:zinc finger BED domain-containing protein 4-like [Acipenser oxyrinchus oxyrinchus]
MLFEEEKASFVKELTVRQQNPSTDITSEVKMYLGLPNALRKTCPLDFWKSQGAKFCTLVKLTKKYLCSPAISVPRERVFSKSRQLVKKNAPVLGQSK